MNMINKIIFGSMLFAVLVVAPGNVLAQSSGTTTKTDQCAQLKSLIQQGGGGQAASLPEFCNEAKLYDRIVYWLYYLIGIVGVIGLIYGGYLYMTARDNESQLGKAKKALLWTIAGVALALLATLIVRMIVNLIVDNKII